MRPLYKMGVIQIEITNACARSCANCTRFCGHHRHPFFMELATFKRAVDSMEGFPGMVGIMGGEPTLHPEFEALIRYYADHVGPKGVLANGREPIENFSAYLIENEMQDWTKKRGLWSSLGRKYYRHFELIQDVFEFQLINDHSNPGLHQSLLVKRKELGISDEEWFPMRDRCWVQNGWSASITPKGAFFCEVAAAMDTLFDGPGGWAVEPGWWKREPKDFGDQLNWCELCGACLAVPRRPASSEVDTVSPEMFEMLNGVDSPKVRKGTVEVFDPATVSKGTSDYSSEWYLPDGDNTQRVGATNTTIMPQRIDVVTELPDAVALAGFSDWVLLNNGEVPPVEGLKRFVLNPGCLFSYEQGAYAFTLFNVRAFTLRDASWSTIDGFVSLWAEDKRVVLTKLEPNDDVQARLAMLHAAEKQKTRVMTEHMLTTWRGLVAGSPRIGLYCAGQHSVWFIGKLREAGLPMPVVLVDDHPHQTELQGCAVVASEEFDPASVDALVVSSDARPRELHAKASRQWPDMVIINPYSEFEKPLFQK